MLKSSRSWNLADVYLVLVHCWDIPNLKTLLSDILSYYNAELFRILKQCRCMPCHKTLLKISQPWNIADVYFVFLHRWAVLNPIMFVSYNLSYYNAELFPFLKHCRCIPCHNTLLKSSQSGNLADVLPVLLHCWAFPNLETMLTNTLSFYIAELFLII